MEERPTVGGPDDLAVRLDLERLVRRDLEGRGPADLDFAGLGVTAGFGQPGNAGQAEERAIPDQTRVQLTVVGDRFGSDDLSRRPEPDVAEDRGDEVAFRAEGFRIDLERQRNAL